MPTSRTGTSAGGGDGRISVKIIGQLCHNNSRKHTTVAFGRQANVVSIFSEKSIDGRISLLQLTIIFGKGSMSITADLIISNARIFTADPEVPTAEAIALRGNRILWVGGQVDAGQWRGKATRMVDGGGNTLMPGFIDSHFHMLHGSLNLDGIHFEDCHDYEQMSAAIRFFARENPNRPWLSGFGLRYNLGPENVSLTRQHLDEIISDRPISITAYDGHTTWANSLALRMAGIFYGGECPPNSEIVLDEIGEATGELKERASQAIDQILPRPDDIQKRSLLKKGLKLAAEMGVTSVHNMDGNDEQAALYAAMEDLGELTARIYIPYSIKPETPVTTLRQEALTLKQNYQSPMLRGGCVKLFMDGVIETYTGLLVDPYEDNPWTNGASNYDADVFNRLVVEADRLGLQVSVHSVGDLGVRRVLNAYDLARQTNGVRDSRHRVEHIEVIHPEDVARFKQLDVIASMQPLHCPPAVDAGDVWPARVGPRRWPLSFAWSILRESGARLVFGSDWPVVSQNPMLGVHIAVNRQPWAKGLPDHRQGLAETLVSYTRDAAFAEFQEDQKGQLRAGFLADLVLLSEDIFSISPENLNEVRPLATWMDGRLVYEA